MSRAVFWLLVCWLVALAILVWRLYSRPDAPKEDK
jgi:hypothetical protein